MATYTTTTAYNLGTAAGTSRTNQGYFIQLKEMRDALVACGWVQTADTGQQDFTLAEGSTVAPPPSLYSSAAGWQGTSGFFIVRFNDALQATKPVFMKFGFYSAQYSQLLGTYLEVGSSTDGAGNVTGYKIDRAHLPFFSASGGGINTANQRLTYASGNGSEFAGSFHEAGNVAQESFMLTIERTRDATGAYDGEGVLINWLPATTVNQETAGPAAAHLAYPTNGRNDALGTGFRNGLIVPRTRSMPSTQQLNNNIGPLSPFGGGFFPKYRHTHVLFEFVWGDQPNYGNTITMSLYGAARTFRNVGYQYSHWNNPPRSFGQGAYGNSTIATAAVMMMWE